MRIQKIIKKIIFALFLLQKVKFEEIRKNCSYIIIYTSLFIIICKKFFLIFLKENRKKDMNIYRHISYIIIYVYMYLYTYSYMKNFLPVIINELK